MIKTRQNLYIPRFIAAIVFTVIAIDFACAQPQETHASEFWTLFGRDLKITDTLLVAFTALLFLATAALWWSTRRLVRGAQRSAERQLRAYVALEGGQVRVINNGTAIEVGVTFKNSGQTPGYQFNIWTCFEIHPPDAVPFTPAPPVDQRGGGTSIIGAGQTAGVTIRANLAAQHTLASLRSGQHFVYLWGQVDYVDIFRRRRHFIFRSTTGSQVSADAWNIGPHKMGYEGN
jgi:hypothetical protein